MSSKVGVIITGGDFQALGAMRTLGKKGIPVYIMDSDFCISRFSKYIKRFIKSPPIADHERYLEFLRKLAKTGRCEGWIILPNDDQAVHFLSKNKDTLKNWFRVPTPEWEVIKNVYIKENTYAIAEENGIPCPKTYRFNSMDGLLNQKPKFPLVVKPSIKDNFYSKIKVKAYLVKNPSALAKVYSFVSQIIDSREIIVQEYLVGGTSSLYSYCPFFKDGNAITGLAARRLRQHPMDFGHASTFAKVVNIPELRRISEKFLRIIGYYGICEVEFMKNCRTGEFKLLEVNPRIWGWHTLAIAAGVDLPFILYCDQLGLPLEPNEVKDKINWIRILTDTPTVINQIIRGKMTVRDYLNSIKGEKEFAVLSWEDPLPFVVELFSSSYLWFKRGF